MSVVVVGLNHRTVPLDLLERMTVPESRLPKALADLTSREHITEAVVLSTCNRIEVYVFAEKFHGAYQDIRNFFAEASHLPPEEFSDHLTGLYDADAARHLFAVASGLDSAVLGEHEILGQVRTAWQTAADEGAVGPLAEHEAKRADEDRLASAGLAGDRVVARAKLDGQVVDEGEVFDSEIGQHAPDAGECGNRSRRRQNKTQ